MVSRWTPRLAVSRSERRIAAARKWLELVSIEWGDVDGGIEGRSEELIRELDQFADEIRASVEDRLAAGEHIGL